MKEFWTIIQSLFFGLGAWLGFFLGGCDGLLYALVIFVAIDYITGVMCAISDKKLSSAVGFKGICRKILIFLLVGLAHILDVQILHETGILRTAVIFFFLSNDGPSILENAAHLGLPIPERLKEVLEQLHDRAEKSGEPAEPEPEEIIGEEVYFGKHSPVVIDSEPSVNGSESREDEQRND